ncbi:HAD-IC family P-type ATPase [Rhodovulum sp. DZ06]|uniref:HAD-IC family P-type ATPase n=1 Tax=Rhodovulum sp. DZ06 TaxID=3425126 RepID=UPI003D358D20
MRDPNAARPGGPAAMPDFHALDIRETLDALGADPGGLDAEEAAARLAAHGPNLLPAPPRPGALLRFLAQFRNVLIYVLLAAAAVTAALSHWVDAGVILAVVLVNAAVGYVQEGRAENAMQAIRQMLAPRCAALRGGRRQGLDAAELVPGDVVLVEAGDRVPADLRLIEQRGLTVQEAILTGEAVPVDKALAPVAADAPLGDRACMLFSGTLVAAGTGVGVVTATGPRTEIGRISGMLAQVEVLTTPLLAQMDRFARGLTVFILALAAALLAWGRFAMGMEFGELFMAVVGLSVAAIPEGLPAVLTITLAVGVQAMARRNAIVRRLPAIETLGSVSVICSDKTGTLTRNEMIVADLVSAAHVYSVEGRGYAPEGAVRWGEADADPKEHAVLMAFARAAALCNDAALNGDGADWAVEGDPMEGALLALAGKIDAAEAARLARSRRDDAIPFDAAHRYMAVLHHDAGGAAHVHVKGAPEAVLALCADQHAADGGAEPLDVEFWQDAVERLAGRGQRVLAVASMTRPGGMAGLAAGDLRGALTLTGLVGLMDPPREEAIAAAAECRAAGIRVKMITGDHAATARAIGAMIGLENARDVLTGADVEAMDDAQLELAAMETDIFARTSPAHKLRLVSALQARGLTVAMTGDGVNDAPALKRADAGVAMGLKGAAAAKEAAELVLADDNFSSIVAAVREGRAAYDNIRKVIGWTLPTNAGEALCVIVALLAGLAPPITAVQILWVNLITAVTLGIALAFEPAEPGVMRRPPRPRDAPLLDAGLGWRIALVSALILAGVFGVHRYALAQGYDPALAGTMAMTTLVALEIFNLFFIRVLHAPALRLETLRGTKVLWGCVLAVAAAQVAVTELGPLQAVFGAAAIPPGEWLVILGVGALFFLVLESEKRLRLALRRQGG